MPLHYMRRCPPDFLVAYPLLPKVVAYNCRTIGFSNVQPTFMNFPDVVQNRHTQIWHARKQHKTHTSASGHLSSIEPTTATATTTRLVDHERSSSNNNSNNNDNNNSNHTNNTNAKPSVATSSQLEAQSHITRLAHLQYLMVCLSGWHVRLA